MHDVTHTFTLLRKVRSIRVTVTFPTTRVETDLIGVKVILFPNINMQGMNNNMDEFLCSGTPGTPDVGLQYSSSPDFIKTWPSRCASPIDRVYCVNRSPSSTDWGAMDDFPLFGFDFAGDWEYSKRFQGHFPTSSVFVDKYSSSWTDSSACRQPFNDPYAEPYPSTCLVTKFFTESCAELSKSGDLHHVWKNSTAKLVLSSQQWNQYSNIKTQAISCVWTRAVDWTDADCDA